MNRILLASLAVASAALLSGCGRHHWAHEKDAFAAQVAQQCVAAANAGKVVIVNTDGKATEAPTAAPATPAPAAPATP